MISPEQLVDEDNNLAQSTQIYHDSKPKPEAKAASSDVSYALLPYPEEIERQLRTEREQPLPEDLREAMTDVLTIPLFEQELGRIGYTIDTNGNLDKLGDDGLPTGPISTSLESVLAARRAAKGKFSARQTAVVPVSPVGYVLTAQLPGPQQTPLLNGKLGTVVKAVAAPLLLLIRGALKDLSPQLADAMYDLLPDRVRAGPSLMESLGHPYDNIELLLAHTTSDPAARQLIYDDGINYLIKEKSYCEDNPWLQHLNGLPATDADTLRCLFTLTVKSFSSTQSYAATQLELMQDSIINKAWPQLHGIIENRLSTAQILQLGLLNDYTSEREEQKPILRLLVATFAEAPGFEKPSDEALKAHAETLISVLEYSDFTHHYDYADKRAYPLKSDQTVSIRTGLEKCLKENKRFISSGILVNFASADRQSMNIGSGKFKQKLKSTDDRKPIKWEERNAYIGKCWRPERALIATHPHLFSDLEPVRPLSQMIKDAGAYPPVTIN